MISKEQVVNQLHKPARKNFERIIIEGLDDLWQTDLAEMKNYAKDNRNFKCIVIYSFSKFGWAKPLTNKTGPEVTNAMDDIFKVSKWTCAHLNTDQGSEFYNVHFKNLLRKHNINHYST